MRRIGLLPGDALSMRADGFTLIELAVALFVMALLLGSLLVPLTTQVEQKQTAETQRTLDDIREALLGYALANGHLPCADASSGNGANDGVEDVAPDGTCAAPEGNLPWVSLSAPPADLWGNRFRYRVDGEFSQRAPAAPLTLASSADVRVCAAAGCAAPLTSTGPNGAVAIILSHGKNGRGAVSASTNAPNAAPAGADESENANANATFVSRAPTPAGASAGEFDDIVSWLSKYVLYSRMVTAGLLP